MGVPAIPQVGRVFPIEAGKHVKAGGSELNLQPGAMSDAEGMDWRLVLVVGGR
jgi:hypothetical protein